jgi:hypothetical protein
MIKVLPSITGSMPIFPSASEALKLFGFKFPPGGPHISRTMMLAELELLLAAIPIDAPAGGYSDAIVSRNVLGKDTESTRLKTLRHLRELYGLSPSLPIFYSLRQFSAASTAAIPQLAFLCAWTRDPLLRATTTPVLSATEGEAVSASALAEAVAETFPSQYSALNESKIARNARATWTSSGHLQGRTTKIRRRIAAKPAAVAYALLLGVAAGLAGEALLSSVWCSLLDLSSEQARISAAQAHRYGFITFRAAGSVIDITFPQKFGGHVA